VDLAAACRVARELFRSAGNGDGFNRIKRADAKWRAGSALAIKLWVAPNCMANAIFAGFVSTAMIG